MSAGTATTIPDAVEAYVRFWETLTPDSLDRLEELAAPDVRFSDPFNDVRGLAGFRAVFEDMFHRVSEPRFRVTGRAVDGDLCFLRWEFTFRGSGRDWRIDGVSELRFDASGRVVSHVDHWDAAGQLYERLPIIGTVLRFLRRRLSA